MSWMIGALLGAGLWMQPASANATWTPGSPDASSVQRREVPLGNVRGVIQHVQNATVKITHRGQSREDPGSLWKRLEAGDELRIAPIWAAQEYSVTLLLGGVKGSGRSEVTTLRRIGFFRVPDRPVDFGPDLRAALNLYYQKLGFSQSGSAGLVLPIADHRIRPSTFAVVEDQNENPFLGRKSKIEIAIYGIGDDAGKEKIVQHWVGAAWNSTSPPLVVVKILERLRGETLYLARPNVEKLLGAVAFRVLTSAEERGLMDEVGEERDAMDEVESKEVALDRSIAQEILLMKRASVFGEREIPGDYYATVARILKIKDLSPDLREELIERIRLSGFLKWAKSLEPPKGR